ncbi:MAG TPA: spore germination protein [Symbiobacteriaceae bacterium]|nr:spore germination protein [Symbiobacteriaceae bacterium]
MKSWPWLQRLLDPAAGAAGRQFTLGDRGDKPEAEDRGATLLSDAQVRTEGVLTHIGNLLDAGPKGKEALDKTGDLSTSLDENVDRLKKLFRMPENKDLIIRDLQIATQPPTRAVVCFMEGITDKIVINDHILKPLMLLAHLDHHIGGEGEAGPTRFSIDTLIKRLLPGHQAAEKYDMAAVAESLLAGDTVLFFENERAAVAVETKAPPGRSVGEPKSEKTVQGANDAFVEAWRVNVALVRRRLKDPRVVTDILKVGRVSNNYVGLMYIDGIASPKLIAEVRRRIEAIDVDVVNSAGALEQFIEDAPGSWMPGLMTTERPDRTAAYLSEGNVAIMVDNAPYALIAPVTFWTLLQTAEDYTLRYPFGSLIRYVRMAALLTTVLVPAIYIALVNYHQEMIPTELMLFIASTREHVPLPALLELLLMDFSFELIREAGTRIPSVIGSTVGLVASLVLGQAAVEAKLISPLIVLIVAVTGLASFAIPNYMAGFGVRAWRFLILLGAALLGFYGIAAVLFALVIYLAGLRSFGIAFLTPVAPLRPLTADAITRAPLYQMEMRPSYTRPLDQRRQSEVVRTWDPLAPSGQGGKKDGKQGEGGES